VAANIRDSCRENLRRHLLPIRTFNSDYCPYVVLPRLFKFSATEIQRYSACLCQSRRDLDTIRHDVPNGTKTRTNAGHRKIKRMLTVERDPIPKAVENVLYDLFSSVFENPEDPGSKVEIFDSSVLYSEAGSPRQELHADFEPSCRDLGSRNIFAVLVAAMDGTKVHGIQNYDAVAHAPYRVKDKYNVCWLEEGRWEPVTIHLNAGDALVFRCVKSTTEPRESFLQPHIYRCMHYL
jgi:hypothetical protein